MEALISKNELVELLSRLNIQQYYIEIDMNGALSLVIAQKYEAFLKKIENGIVQIDRDRTVDMIYDADEFMLYPVKCVQVDDGEDEEYLEQLNKKEFLTSTYSQQLNVWVNPHRQKLHTEKRPPRITFYSYKGGVGRSTALAVTARLLASEGFRVGIIDLDLEAPGINSLLFSDPKSCPFGVVDYLFQAQWAKKSITKEKFLSQYIVREMVTRRNSKPGMLYMMPAGGTVPRYTEGFLQSLLAITNEEKSVDIFLEPNYLQKLSYVDFDVFARQSTHVFESLLEDFAVYTEADIILIDARTGIANVSGALLTQFSDYVSIHIQDNRQNWEGVQFIVKHLQDNLDKILWSHTKVSKSLSGDMRIKRLIQEEIGRYVDKDDMQPIQYFNLPHDNALENASAMELKNYIQEEKFSLRSYRELEKAIVSTADLDSRLKNYIPREERKRIIEDIKTIPENACIYISKRFLNPDITQFVSFPGSGAATFKAYMEKTYQKKVEITPIEDFITQRPSAFKILSQVTVLDWNEKEAKQALCKWILQSAAFREWIIRKEIESEEVVQKFIGNPEYELENEVVEDILQILLDNPLMKMNIKGWGLLVSFCRHRREYTLPEDLIHAIKLWTNWKKAIRSAIKNKTYDGNVSLFGMPVILQEWRKNLFKNLSDKKMSWLKTVDEDVFALVDTIRMDFSEHKSAEVQKIALQKKMKLDEKSFEAIFQKASALGVVYISPALSIDGSQEKLVVPPIYSYFN